MFRYNINTLVQNNKMGITIQIDFVQYCGASDNLSS